MTTFCYNLFFACLITLLNCSDYSAAQDARQPVIVNVHYHGAGAYASNEASNLVMNNPENKVIQPIAVSVELPAEQTFYDNVEQLHWRASSLKIRHIAIAALTGTVLGLWTSYWRYYFLVHSKHAWSQWRQGISLEELYQMPYEQLRKKFLEALRKKYHKGTEKPHVGHLLFNFEKELVGEINSLTNYSNFYHFTKKTRLSWLLPSQESLYTMAQNNLKRLEFLQQLANKMTASFLE